ncbi:MFS transporter [Alcaligenes sp. SORT26]|uniref:MFS transporter n=1 Tax=Alcaligenes sp. SORT26 TaxID=2813780 RepID=UPI001A9D75F0|nr:MFS transporter [Alcaligenes sp. SORT26]QTB99042.1 MFS transporter [Alcaligenes sp. SORT26]
MGDTYFRTTHYQFSDLDSQAQDAYINSLTEQARAKPSCLRFDVLRKDQPPGQWVLHESWRDSQSCKDFHASAPAQTLQKARIEQCLNHPAQQAAADKPAAARPAGKKSQWDPYVWISIAMCIGVMGTALASPLYPLYQDRWDLNASHITQLYVAYMAAGLTGLLFLGRLSDLKGFMPVLRTGLILVTSGVTLSAFAWDVGSFLFSRIMIGMASSMIVTSASIGLGQFNRGGDVQRAAATTSLMLAFGFGLGPVVGGLIAQWIPNPLFSSYIPSMALGVLAIYALFQIKPIASKQPVPQEKSSWRTWMPRLTLPATHLRRPYLIGCLSACCAFAMFSLFASLAPSFMAQMVPWHGPATSGLSIGIILFMSSGFQLLIRRWPAKRSVIVGLLSFTLACIALLVNLWASSSLLFILCVLLTAFGHGLCMYGGMSIVQRVSPPHQRAGLTSTYLITGYLGAILPILGLGWLADHLGLDQGLMIFCGLIATAALTVSIIAYLTPVLHKPTAA